MRALWLTIFALLAGAPAAGATVLNRTVELNSPASASVLVDVPHPIAVDPFKGNAPPFPELLAGAEGITVVDLRRIGMAAGRRMHMQFYFSGGKAMGWIATMTTNQPGRDAFELRAGRYRLTVATTGPVRARLTFPTLDGESALTPTEPEPAIQSRELPASPFSPPGTVAFGGDGELSQSGDVFAAGRLAAREEEVVQRAGFCLFPGGGPPTGAAAYEPGCPGGGERAVLFEGATGVTHLLGVYEDVEAGRSGVGWNFSRAGESPEARAWGVWMPVRTDGVQPDPASEPPAPAQPPPAQPVGTVSVPVQSVRVRRGRIRVPLRCTTEGPCAGRLALGRRGGRFTLPAGRRGHVVLRVPRKRRAVSLTLTTTTATGVAQSRVRLRLRHR